MSAPAGLSRWLASSSTVRAFFDGQAASWEEGYKEQAGMHSRLERFAVALASRTSAGGEVLDFGCGTGAIARRLAAAGYRVTGADVSPNMLRAASDRDASRSITWVQVEPGALLPFENARFDAAISSSVLEYVDDPSSVLAELARVVRRDGWLLVTVPDQRHSSRKLEALLRLPLLVPPGSQLLARTPWRAYFAYLGLSRNRQAPGTWYQLLERAGFRPAPLTVCEGPLLLLQARRC